MSTVKSVVPFLVMAAACTPQNAVLQSGNYIAFFDASSSATLAKGTVDPADPEFDYHYNLDCREFETPADRRAYQLEDPIPCGDVFPTVDEVWANQAGFRVVGDALAPWRGEAIITSEGDLQVGFHQRMPGGADMRFIFAVDPDFQPTLCKAADDGSLVREPKDGDWIAEWSTELPRIAERNDDYQLAFDHMAPYLDNGRLFFMNSQSYQINPRTVGDFWSLPDQFEAGASRGKIAEEDLIPRRSIWAYPFVYAAVDDPADDGATVPFDDGDLWWCELPEGADPNTTPCSPAGPFVDMDDLEATIEATADETHDELQRVFRPVNGEDPVFDYRTLTHANRWRPSDGVPSGFDGWGEMHYNYVVFSADSNLEVGGRAEGAFSMAFEAVDSWTQVFMRGTFVIDKIKADRWITQDLRAIKAAENGVELCFQQ